MKKRQNADVLPSLIDLKGQKVADIGCGAGPLTRLMTRHGATVIGVECSKKQLERARAAKPAGNEIYTEGVGEDLSFENEKLDLVVFLNSLHHIAPENQDKALGEAARVLKPGGRVYVCEPVAKGKQHELMQPVHDETETYRAALGALKKAKNYGLTQEKEITYIHTDCYADFEAFQAHLLSINPHLEGRFAELKETLEEKFETLGHKTDDGMEFTQPARVNLFIKDD